MASYDIFKDLKKSEINCIVDSGMIRTIDAGKVLFRKGDIGHEMFIVLKGKVKNIKQTAEAISAIKGVKLSRFNIMSIGDDLP